MESSLYESSDLLEQYLLFHYGMPEVVMPWEFGPVEGLNFPARVVQEGLVDMPEGYAERALDIGCAVGRSTFELARHFRSVTGIDYSHSFIFTARTLSTEQKLPFEYKVTGKIRGTTYAVVPDVDCSRVRFEVGDAQALPESLGVFDCVLAANLLCRLQRPEALLRRLPGLIRKGGRLIVTTPNTWLEEFTAEKYWIGATPETGEPLEALQKQLGADFRFLRSKDVPFVIREHSRKYQWSVAQLSVWEKQF